MNIVLDTGVLLYLLTGHLEQALPTANFFISIITEMELMSYPLLNSDDEVGVYSFLSDVTFLSEVTVVDLNAEIRSLAVALRRQHQIKLPDAIVAATAIHLKAVLYTNDNKMLKIPALTAQILTMPEVKKQITHYHIAAPPPEI